MCFTVYGEMFFASLYFYIFLLMVILCVINISMKKKKTEVQRVYKGA